MGQKQIPHTQKTVGGYMFSPLCPSWNLHLNCTANFGKDTWLNLPGDGNNTNHRNGNHIKLKMDKCAVVWCWCVCVGANGYFGMVYPEIFTIGFMSIFRNTCSLDLLFFIADVCVLKPTFRVQHTRNSESHSAFLQSALNYCSSGAVSVQGLAPGHFDTSQYFSLKKCHAHFSST